MTWITKKVEAAGATEEEITLSLVDQMFLAVVADEFLEGEHNRPQMKWSMAGGQGISYRRSKQFLIVCLQAFCCCTIAGDSG